MGLTEKYESWKKKVKDRKLFRELLGMTKEEINSAFYKDLEFGTAGIRGVIGAGTNKLNVYTIRKITQGIVLRMQELGKKKVAISYDSRINSELFAREAACVFAASEISVVITSELMPSPFLSYLTRAIGADYGVMITASHNPKEYNGYKVYDASGCQIRDEEAAAIADNITRVDAFRLRVHSFDFYFKKGLISYSSEKTEMNFTDEIISLCGGTVKGMKVVYTPLCGTGYRLVPEVLTKIGCTVLPVETQNEPNGKFLTCPVPNPEKREALKYGIKELRATNADLLIATDPDADRIGVAFVHEGETVVLNGNEIGVLLCDYLLSHYHGNSVPIIVRTLVSTDLADKLAETYGAELITVPTGFKYIGEVINSLEKKKSKRFILGFEESQGYLLGTHVRDKDAVSTAAVIALMAYELKEQGKTFYDRLEELYQKYGYYSSTQFSFTFEGEEGARQMKALLKELKDAPLDEKVRRTDSFSLFDRPTDMISYEFDGGKIFVRPSGTEPLIKVYVIAHRGKSENEKLFKQAEHKFGEFIDEFLSTFDEE